MWQSIMTADMELRGFPQKKKKPTKEDMQKVNAINKARLCQHRLIQYFTEGDYFATLTYKVSERPPDMKTAKKHWEKLIRYIRKEYKKRGSPLYWIRNIECGTKGAWHIHIVINRIPDSACIVEEAWPYGGTYFTQLKKVSTTARTLQSWPVILRKASTHGKRNRADQKLRRGSERPVTAHPVICHYQSRTRTS